MAVSQTLLVRLFTIGLNVATGVVTARYLGPTGRSELAAVLLGTALLPSLVSFGLGIATQYRILSEPERELQVVSAATSLAILLGLLALAIGYFILPYMIAKYSVSVLFAARFAMLVAPLAMLNFSLCSVLRARHQFKEANVSDLAMPMSTLVALLMLMMAHALTPMTSAAAYLVPFIWVVPWLWAKVKPRLRVRELRQSALSLLDYGARSCVSEILGSLATQVDQVLVIGMLSPFSMGLYTVALSAARPGDFFSGPIIMVLFPRACALDSASAVALTARATRITTALLFISAIALIATMPILLPLFYGAAFVSAVPVAQLVVVSVALNGIVAVMAQAFMANGRPGVFGAIQMLGLATIVPTMLILIPRFGLIGAAWALIISTLIRLLFTVAGCRIVLKAVTPWLLLSTDDLSYILERVGAQMRRETKRKGVREAPP
jgi:antigen flippase